MSKQINTKTEVVLLLNTGGNSGLIFGESEIQFSVLQEKLGQKILKGAVGTFTNTKTNKTMKGMLIIETNHTSTFYRITMDSEEKISLKEIEGTWE